MTENIPEEKKESESLSSRALKGGMWVFILKTAQRSVGIVRIIILARLLAPSDFGLFGVAALTIDFLENFSVTGINAALIQKKESIKEYLDTAWTVNIIRSILLFAILFFGAPLVAHFFNSPEALNVVRVLALFQLILGFENSAIVYFQKEIRFDRMFILKFGGILVNAAVSITLAFILKSVWALVWGALAGAFTRTVVSFFLHPYRPKFRLDKEKAKELLNFGKWLFGSSMLIFLITQGDDVFLGKVLGLVALGFYQMAYNISNAPATEISNFVAQVTFPVYSKLQENISRLRDAYLKVFKLITFFSFPIAALIFVLAPEFTSLFLGDKWMPIVPVMRILVIWGVIRAIGATTTQIFYAVGEPKINTKLMLLQLSLIVIGIYPLTMMWGMQGTAISVVIAGFFPNIIACYLTMKKVKSSFYDFGKMLILPLVNALIMAAVVFAFKSLSVSFLMFFVAAGAGAAVYIAITGLFNRFLGYDAWYVFKEIKRELKGAE